MRCFGLLLSISLVGCSFDGSVSSFDQNPGDDPGSANDAATFDGNVTPDGPVGVSDMDGDGLLDDVDNCPTVSNAEQFNEDGDGLGNSCDNCPGEDNPTQANADSDELGDACDPQPGQDNKLLYFEGFDVLPEATSWNGLGSWQVDNGALVQTDNSQRYYLRYEDLDGSDKIKVVAKLQFSNPLGPNNIAFRYGGVIVEANADPDNNGCWVLRSLSQSIEGYSGVGVSNGSPSGTTPTGGNVVDNSDYVIASSVDGASRSCEFKHAAASPVSFQYNGTNSSGQNIGIVTSFTQVRVAYLYAVRLQ